VICFIHPSRRKMSDITLTKNSTQIYEQIAVSNYIYKDPGLLGWNSDLLRAGQRDSIRRRTRDSSLLDTVHTSSGAHSWDKVAEA
jgi:hypothetical protein